MAILPKYKLVGPGGTVDLSRAAGPEELARPTENTGTEVRRCLSQDGETPGRVYLLVDPYGLPGQTMTTSHRVMPVDFDELLTEWNRSKEVIEVQLEDGNFPVVVMKYDAAPRNRRFKWATQATVAELTIMFVEED